jgi:hypothetical protein
MRVIGGKRLIGTNEFRCRECGIIFHVSAPHPTMVYPTSEDYFVNGYPAGELVNIIGDAKGRVPTKCSHAGCYAASCQVSDRGIMRNYLTTNQEDWVESVSEWR